MMKQRGLSDGNLLSLRRKVVHKIFNDRCFFCHRSIHEVPMEDHHLVKRKMFLLKYDWRNGILLCKYNCHEYAETPTGKHLISEYLIKNNLLDYLQKRSGNCKQWFVDHNTTRKEFLISIYDDLKAKLNEEVF